MNAMDGRWIKARFSKRAAVAIQLLLIALVISLAGLLYLVSDLQHQWRTYERVTALQKLSLTRLQQQLGYGGFIHHFKNYVLRQDPEYLQQAREDLKQALGVVSQYEHFRLASEEQVAVSMLRQTLEALQGNLELARQAVAIDSPIAEIDTQVSMDNTSGLTALSLLQQYSERTQTQQFGELSGRIDLLRSLLILGLVIVLVLGVLVYYLRDIWLTVVPAGYTTAGDMLLPELHQPMLCDLTRIPNRRALFQTGAGLLKAAHKNGKPLSVLYVDVDNFRQINELLGPAVGDRVLLEVATRLRSKLAPGDFVARIGGDEFALILQQRDALSAARQMAQSLMNVVTADYAELERENLLVSCSVGGAMFPDDGTDLETLLKVADLRMYTVRRSQKKRLTKAG